MTTKDQPVDELAIKLTRLFYGDSTARTVKMGETYPVTVHQALALIQAECNRARRDELRLLDCKTWLTAADVQTIIDKRIAELQQLMKEGE